MQKIGFLLCSSLILPLMVLAQVKTVTLSGIVKDYQTKSGIAFANVSLLQLKDSSLKSGTITDEEGRFELRNILSGEYLLQVSYTGYISNWQQVVAGKLTSFLHLGVIELPMDTTILGEVKIAAKQQEGVSNKMDKKTYSIAGNISQSGGSVLQAMKNLPGITITEEGKVQLRGSDKVMLLVDGKQTALTGFGSQAALDNIPSSAIERIEIINNPSARYDAAGQAGIINIVYKKSKQQGFNGKIGLITGLGALWEKKENLPTIDEQYKATPKINPSLSLNYRKNGLNVFIQGDYLYNKTLNRNDFATRYYTGGDTIQSQVKRNRITTVGTAKAGTDWQMNDKNLFTISGLFSSEYVRDSGDIPYFQNKLTERSRLWQFYEDEVNTAATVSAGYQHKFNQPGHSLTAGFNYTFHREDEKYFLTDTHSTYTGRDTFMLIADEHVSDVNIDYIRPLKRGHLEAGVKFRQRNIPTNMEFFPGINSPLDTGAAGWARYRETIPALYGNYIYESKNLEIEAGMRLEYVLLNYDVNPDHNTYESDGYEYFEPFPNLRISYSLNQKDKISFFYNRRVDRPDEGDIRIFPKYDEPEILKVGNPGLRPQFTHTAEAGYKREIKNGSFYSAIYFRATKGTITRIGTIVPNDPVIYNILQNAGHSYSAGVELLLQQQISKTFSYNASVNIYRARISAFTVENAYPVPTTFSTETERITSANLKLNGLLHLPRNTEIQATVIYLAPDIIPQGKIFSRFSVDAGIKKGIQKGKGELFANVTDIFNSLNTRKEIRGDSFLLVSTDYYETQVIRIGYAYKF